MLSFASGAPFATGAAQYDYRPVTTQEEMPRVVVRIAIDRFETAAFVDTGGVYLICSPEVALRLRLNSREGLPVPRILLRGVWLSGRVYSLPVALLAEQGEGVTIRLAVFVPELSPDQVWADEFPCVLGMHGCLERLRFAIDPGSDTFFFGDLSEAT